MRLLQPFDRGVLIHEGVFERATNKVFDWSKAEGCRFYSIIRDGTGPTSKLRYKKLRTLVENRFYPLHRPLSAATSHHERPPPEQRNSAVPTGGPYVPLPRRERGQ
jgi:hypothetical protein